MILVTGATGKIGQEVVAGLQSRGARFRAGLRSPDKARGYEAIAFDFDRPETFASALEGVDRLFLLTSGGTEREIPAVEAARRAGVSRIVKLSVWGAENEDFAFARHHRAVERALEKSGLAWTFLRPNGFMQNFLGLAGSIRSQSAFYQPGADFRYSIIDARDVAAAAVLALTEEGHEGRAYRLSGPETLSNVDIADKLSRAVGKKISAVFVTEDQYTQGLIAAGVPPDYAAEIVDLDRHYRTGACEEVTPWVGRLTGRAPGSFDAFARDFAGAWK